MHTEQVGKTGITLNFKTAVALMPMFLISMRQKTLLYMIGKPKFCLLSEARFTFCPDRWCPDRGHFTSA